MDTDTAMRYMRRAVAAATATEENRALVHYYGSGSTDQDWAYACADTTSAAWTACEAAQRAIWCCEKIMSRDRSHPWLAWAEMAAWAAEAAEEDGSGWYPRLPENEGSFTDLVLGLGD